MRESKPNLGRKVWNELVKNATKPKQRNRMSKEIEELNTRFIKLGNLHSRRIADTRKAIRKLVEALGRHIPGARLTADEQREIERLLGRE